MLKISDLNNGKNKFLNAPVVKKGGAAHLAVKIVVKQLGVPGNHAHP
jgi:hypothetical protein